MYKLYWVDKDNSGVLFDLGGVLEKYEYVFVGRLSDEDFGDAKKHGVLVEDYSALYIFKPGAFYHYMKLEDSYVSRRHARIELRNGGLYIIDHGHEGRGSTNGTFINGRRIGPGKPCRLEHGDEVSLGSTTRFIVIYGDRDLTISTPIILGRGEIEELRKRGVKMNESYSEVSKKYLAFILEETKETETLIETRSGLHIRSKPNYREAIGVLILEIREAISKLDNRERDARDKVSYILSYYDLIKDFVEIFLEERRSRDNLQLIRNAVSSLKNYAKGYSIDEKIAKENLRELETVLRALVEILRCT